MATKFKFKLPEGSRSPNTNQSHNPKLSQVRRAKAIKLQRPQAVSKNDKGKPKAPAKKITS